ncbi:hypothetical protein COCC4DRAFT_80154 [Bipolaris maydis ATCC 48331]|uniref:Rhodopsin domain-containing protein n=2 Tax=Cochliobolus heterostrophus TaxID=5016 RepID=M2SPU4_COCH5|nr:uncharacterized protein COCC4DRAFT_80154 [Bipolaris maydis ATCC 48331]EMD87320.1 hypothetical protein COCHEDRAFT_1206576 [Bipolaris maydis C5]KAJ5023385.1 hypothetical protein J3E73DRAFT_426356 [Bipolaris maydis]ENI06519.1 hypothetical protein COCC4DRAFT_80154 [Bipolaris maydis ATCC 48331]KAJ6212271.1 hypothetical protein PSV09DRAFT_1206576 [Bipolaris maydis]KAJ6266823.1 hypothetical protein PSV08DRAFT_365191 [Bipolaris maydis]
MDQLTADQLAALARDDKGPLTKSIVIAFTVLSYVAVSLRLFTRMRYIGLQLGWEDYAIVVSLATGTVASVFQVLQADAGNGKHAIFIEFPEGFRPILKYLFWSIIFYNISLTFTKISILLQYGRIFTVRKMRIPLHIIMAMCIAWGVAMIIIAVYTCEPLPAKDGGPKQSSCVEGSIIWFVNAAVNILTDLLVAFLPVKVIWNLQIAKRPKIALVMILTIGCYTTYYSAPVAYWSSIEMNLAIVCASLPALKPLMVKILPGFSTRGGSNNSYGPGTDGLDKSKSMIHGVRSTARRAGVDDIELGSSSHAVRPDKSSDDNILGKNIYVSRHFEQHYDDSSRISDSESQKDLVRH